MNLQAKLEKQKKESAARIPEDVFAIMNRETENLRNSGIMDNVLKPGDKAPDFFLPNTSGAIISSKDLLAKGFLVINFYRGVW